ncbi:ABC transporter ATP-binding protein [Erythrobacter sp. BLCC-B19]|uniref:ABC transporter ATP-binding protein n=1 Tax=Erythrobacter sp. BLCC-B19 TaxID=3025315 RepID=UPI002361C648|nr:ATP-binding cassette domain-containing protein [Erythrobacter sp. BLCC-B19]WDA39669.1 ATP-binding cassette domain-containing protein [Erythrobacter sp. BLCC-B19]
MELAAHNLVKAYDGRRVLSEVSLTLAAGERALLLGPSGSGKSTLLNCLCGLQQPDAGAVTFGQEVLAAASRPSAGDAIRRRHFGIVFQTLRLVSALSVRANLALAQKLQMGRADPALADRTLERLALTHRFDARPHELSQGEAQRAAIARAVVVRPAILVADEPTSALDHANAARVATLLLDLAQETGASLLIATHDERLRAHFPRTLTLAEGRLAP